MGKRFYIDLAEIGVVPYEELQKQLRPLYTMKQKIVKEHGGTLDRNSSLELWNKITPINIQIWKILKAAEDKICPECSRLQPYRGSVPAGWTPPDDLDD